MEGREGERPFLQKSSLPLALPLFQKTPKQVLGVFERGFVFCYGYPPRQPAERGFSYKKSKAQLALCSFYFAECPIPPGAAGTV